MTNQNTSRFDKVAVHVSSVLMMTGQGMEYLVDADGNVLAKFFDGQMVYALMIMGDPNEVTKAA